jgi:hypothetical protein
MPDAVDGRSAARGRNTIVRKLVRIPQISTLGCGTSVGSLPCSPSHMSYPQTLCRLSLCEMTTGRPSPGER